MGTLDTRSTPTITIPLLTSPLKGEERGDFLLLRRGMPKPQLPQLSAPFLVPSSRLMGHGQFRKGGQGEILFHPIGPTCFTEMIQEGKPTSSCFVLTTIPATKEIINANRAIIVTNVVRMGSRTGLFSSNSFHTKIFSTSIAEFKRVSV